MKTKMLGVLLIAVLFGVNTCLAAGPYKIGVLAKNGRLIAIQQWKATADYLSATIADKYFEIVPLSFEAVFPAIEKRDVDFFLVNSSMFVTAKDEFGASAVATMLNSRQGKPLKSFGGVIFTSSTNDEINAMADLKGKKFMAVKKSSFGGWQMANKEFNNIGINPEEDFAELTFGGSHETVVWAVQSGVFDAGTVRTDTLERMQAQGVIDMEDFKIINKKEHADFSFVCSTTLYPEWPLAKVKATPDALVKEVVGALKKIKPSDTAAKSAKVVGWVDPLDYEPVEDLQKALKVGSYSKK